MDLREAPTTSCSCVLSTGHIRVYQHTLGHRWWRCNRLLLGAILTDLSAQLSEQCVEEGIHSCAVWVSEQEVHIMAVGLAPVIRAERTKYNDMGPSHNVPIPYVT